MVDLDVKGICNLLKRFNYEWDQLTLISQRILLINVTYFTILFIIIIIILV